MTQIHHQPVAGILQQYKPGVFPLFQDLKSPKKRVYSQPLLLLDTVETPSPDLLRIWSHLLPCAASFVRTSPLSLSNRNGFLFRYFDAFNRESDWIQSPEPRPDGEADGRHSA